MSYNLIKSNIDPSSENINDTFDRVFNRRFNCHNTDSQNKNEFVGEKYFNLQIKNKNYPSCYQYNVLIMLAKRLISENQELETKDEYQYQEALTKKLVSKIIDC